MTRYVSLVAATLGFLLACSGIGGGGGKATDQTDPAEEARLVGDFTTAEQILQERLSADPSDAASWRLWGDVNLTRGKTYAQRWKENLGWAIEKYGSAVAADGADCISWDRLGVVLLAASGNPQTAPNPAYLDALPLAQGWESCPGAALLQIEELRRPSDAELSAAEQALGRGADPYQALDKAAPHLKAAYSRIDWSGISWKQAYDRPVPDRGAPFVVLKYPVKARGVGGARPRDFTYAESLTVTRQTGTDLVYLDKRFPQRIPSHGVVQATGCPGTAWSIAGPDRVAVGQCISGYYDRRGSPVYDPSRLKPAGTAHYEHSLIAGAVINVFDIAEGSVNCTGGPVGRLFVDVPGCPVDYDKAIRQTRKVPTASGMVAFSEQHADRMVEARRMALIYGEDLATHLSEGNVGIGMPFAMFAYTQPDYTGCKGRALYTKADLVEDALDFTCQLQGTSYTFRALTLVEIKKAG